MSDPAPSDRATKPIDDPSWEVVDFRPEPSGTGLVAVYQETDGTTTWLSVVGWLGFADSTVVSPLRRWGAGVVVPGGLPEVEPAWLEEGYLGIYDPSGGVDFDEWVKNMTPKVEHWQEEPMRIKVPEGARLVDMEPGPP
jgi:hypothetical protein